jgi:predicted ferric reductase
MIESHIPPIPPAVQPPVKSSTPLITIILAAAIGLGISAFLMPAWLPGLAASVSGTAPTVYWYLSRATAIIAYASLWLTMVWGLLLSTRMAQSWPGTPVANDLHKFVSLLGLAMGGMHGLLLLGDHYMNFKLVQLLIPFASPAYRPLWVGFGQLSFYVWGLVILSFYIRKHIGARTWRVLHFASFATYAMALLHGITAGTDTGTSGMSLLYWVSGGMLLMLVFYRILTAMEKRRLKALAQQQVVPN